MYKFSKCPPLFVIYRLPFFYPKFDDIFKVSGIIFLMFQCSTSWRRSFSESVGRTKFLWDSIKTKKPLVRDLRNLIIKNCIQEIHIADTYF